MKTLNKTLSLVLVLVMVLGMFGVASAAEFTDADDVKYTEAVGVMTGIGAINGYTDGSIKPTGAITREEAAKLVAYSILGADVAANLATGATGFSDVDTGRWSAPYISYLVGKGIISGMGDGTFAPTANVTGYQLAKMMLCAAGYGVKGEYTGASWQLNVAVDAGKNGVQDDATGVDYTKAATREEAMLYAFNGITKVHQVVYNNVFGGYVAKNSITGQISASPTIAEDLYGAKLVPEYAKDSTSEKIVINAAGALTGGEDAFGRPADKWEFKGKEISVATLEPTVSYTSDMHTSASNKAAAEKTLNKYTIDANAKIVYNDATADKAATVADIIAATGNGTNVDIYANGTTIVRVAVITEQLDKVTYLDTVKEEVVLDSGRRTDLGYGKVAVGDYVVTAYKAADNTTVAYLAKASTVKGVASTKSTRDNTITVDGKAYGVGAGATANLLTDFTVSTKGDATLYLDEYGYILKAEAYGNTAADVIAVTDIYAAMDGNKVVQVVEGKNSNGETVTYVDDKTATPAKGEIVVVSTGATSGTYKFAAATTDATAYVYAPAGAYDLDASARKATVAAGKSYYFASDVKFIFASTDKNGSANAGEDFKVSVATGVQAAKDPDATNTNTAVYITKKVGNTEEIVAVFVNGLPKTTANVATDLVFLADVDGTVYVDGKTYYNYLAVQNGALIKDCYGFAAGEVAWTTGATPYTVGQFYTVSKNDKGIYTFDRFNMQTGSLRNLDASVVTTLNSAKTAIETVNLLGTKQPTVDVSKAVIANLDTRSVSSGGAISNAVSDLINTIKDASVAKTTKVGVPMIAAVYNDNGAASMVYFFVKNDAFTKVQAAKLMIAGGAMTVAEATTNTGITLADLA